MGGDGTAARRLSCPAMALGRVNARNLRRAARESGCDNQNLECRPHDSDLNVGEGFFRRVLLFGAVIRLARVLGSAYWLKLLKDSKNEMGC